MINPFAAACARSLMDNAAALIALSLLRVSDLRSSRDTVESNSSIYGFLRTATTIGMAFLCVLFVISETRIFNFN